MTEPAGIAVAEAGPALAGFTGAKRRFELRGTTASGATVYDDYAHHPTEVRATLEAARTLGARRVIAAFQPHLYSRTRKLASEFGRALALADAAHGRRVWWTPTHDDAQRLLERVLEPGDVLVTLGAGDVDRLAERLVAPAR